MARKTRAAAAAKQAQKELEEERVVEAEEDTASVAEEIVPDETIQEEKSIESNAETKLTMEERMAKMKDLRKKMVSSLSLYLFEK